MQVMEIEFTARRYHATPWGAHVNEGRVEWPPCPWRLIRALMAVGYHKLGWTTGPDPVSESLLGKLAECIPTYSLPVSSESHVRHYMPIRDGAKEKSAKVFDTFLRFRDPSDRLLLRYETELSPAESAKLSDLCEGLSYLGRAESWIDARILSPEKSEEATRLVKNWVGLAGPQSSRRRRLLAPMETEVYSAWREQSVEEHFALKESDERKAAEAKGKTLTPAKTKKLRKAAEAQFPSSLILAFQQDTSDWQKQGWPSPPGSRWVDYEVPDDVFDRSPLHPRMSRRNAPAPEAILLAIDGEGERGSLRPLIHGAVRLMDLLHAESVRNAASLELGHVSVLAGTDAEGKPLSGRHDHAHWIPMSLFGKDAIDHVLVYASRGFSPAAIQAVGSIRKAYAKGIRSLSVNIVGEGSIEEMRGQLRRLSRVDPDSLAVMGGSQIWESATPLVLRKYLHRRGKKTVEGQIREELAERGFPVPKKVHVWDHQRAAGRGLKGFVLSRNAKKQQPPCERSWAVTIEFDEWIADGPLALGYASHFGLGLFRAVTAPLS